MAHVDDGQLNALLDGELSPVEAHEVEAHVASCAECTQRLNEARAFLSEAGELLAVLTPPPRAAETPKAAVMPPRIAKTSKEVAVSVDGRTEMTPAIRPVFKHEVPAPPRRSWKLPNLEKLAWAASVVLAVGVGYLGHEVYSLRKLQTTADNGRQRQTADSGRQPQQVAVNSAPAPSREERRGAGPSAQLTTRPSDHLTIRPSDRQSRTLEPSPITAPTRVKPPTVKPAAEISRPRAEQIAVNTPAPAATQGAGAMGSAQPAAPPAAALGDLAGARNDGRANSLDEAAISTRALAAPATVPTTFQRVAMEEAVRHLSGSIRLIDGMNPSRIELGPGRLVAGANPDREVVRVTYTTGTNRLVLDQQLGDPRQNGSFNGLMQGDTLVTALGSNGTQVRWVDRKFWLSLTGGMTSDSVRALVERIR